MWNIRRFKYVRISLWRIHARQSVEFRQTGYRIKHLGRDLVLQSNKSLVDERSEQNVQAGRLEEQPLFITVLGRKASKDKQHVRTLSHACPRNGRTLEERASRVQSNLQQKDLQISCQCKDVPRLCLIMACKVSCNLQ